MSRQEKQILSLVVDVAGVIGPLSTTASSGNLVRSKLMAVKMLYLLLALMCCCKVEYEVSIGRISMDDLMIFVDGHDVMLQKPLSELLATYEKWPDSP